MGRQPSSDGLPSDGSLMARIIVDTFAEAKVTAEIALKQPATEPVDSALTQWWRKVQIHNITKMLVRRQAREF